MSHWLCVRGCCGVCVGDEKGFHIVGFNDNLRHCHRIHTAGPRLAHPRHAPYYIHLGRRCCALARSNISDCPPRNTKTANKMMWMMTTRPLWQRLMHDRHRHQRCDRLRRGRSREISVAVGVATRRRHCNKNNDDNDGDEDF